MCDLKDGFKLCTCDGKALQQPDWTLSRWRASRRITLRRGRLARQDPLTGDDEARIAALIEALQRGDCLDFDYSPRQGDVFTFHGMEGRSLRIRYDEGAWQHDRSTPFTDWRSQMVAGRSGKLQLGAEPDADEDAAVLRGVVAAPTDDARRQVASDWFRERGRDVLAEWLRLEISVAHGGFEPRFREVARRLGRRLRAKLSRGPVEGCDAGECPGHWEALPNGKDELVRRCPKCGVDVSFVDHASDVPHLPHVRAPSLRSVDIEPG